MGFSVASAALGCSLLIIARAELDFGASGADVVLRDIGVERIIRRDENPHEKYVANSLSL